MAAPSTAYTNFKIPFHKYGIAKYDSYAALKLSEYGSAIKDFFFLDALLVGKKGTNEGFVGIIENNPSSLNYKMHNPSRFNKSRFKDRISGKIYIILNDGGLNIRGYSATPNVTTPVYVGDNIVFNNIFKSPYYDDATAHGWIFTNTRTNAKSTVDLGGLANKTQYSASYNNAIPPSLGARAGDVIQIVSFVSSPEDLTLGDWNSPAASVTLQVKQYNFGWDQYASVAYQKYLNSTFTAIYIDNSPITNANLYKDAAMTINADLGYYANANYWYKVENVGGKSRITDLNSTDGTHWPPDDPTNITPFNWRGYNPSTNLDYGQSCAVATNSRTTFRDNATNIHYKDGNKTQIADNGTYTIMTGPTTWYWHRIINGISTQQGICGGG